jgi:O-antigen/teichoic acid export membrane protein
VESSLAIDDLSSNPEGAEDHGRSHRPSLQTGLSFGALSFITSTVIAIVSSIITARIYGVHVMGQFALVTAPSALIWLLSNAGEQVASVRFLVGFPPRHPRATGIFFVVFSFSMILTTTVGLLLLPGTYLLLNGPVDHPGLFGAAAVSTLSYIFISNPAWNLETPFSAFMAARELFWIRLAQPLVFLAVSVGLSIANPDVWALVIATIVSWAVSLLHRLHAIRPYIDLRLRREEFREARKLLPEILSFGIRIVPGTLATGFAYEIGVWVLGATQSVSAVGSYNRAWSVIRRFIEVNWRIPEMLYPSLIQRRADGDEVGFATVSLDMMRYVLIIALLPAAVGGGGAESVMSVFGPGFAVASTALAVLLLTPCLSQLQTLQELILLANDRPGRGSIASIGQMLVVVAATFALTPVMGITGPAVALLIGFVVALGYQGFALHGTYGAPVRSLLPWQHVVGPIVAYAAAFVVSRICSDAVGPVIPSLLVIGLLGTLTYVGVLALIARPLDRDRDRLRKAVGGRFPRRRQDPAQA